MSCALRATASAVPPMTHAAAAAAASCTLLLLQFHTATAAQPTPPAGPGASVCWKCARAACALAVLLWRSIARSSYSWPLLTLRTVAPAAAAEALLADIRLPGGYQQAVLVV
jgi:hypothetical protein